MAGARYHPEMKITRVQRQTLNYSPQQDSFLFFLALGEGKNCVRENCNFTKIGKKIKKKNAQTKFIYIKKSLSRIYFQFRAHIANVKSLCYTYENHISLSKKEGSKVYDDSSIRDESRIKLYYYFWVAQGGGGDCIRR